MFDKAKLNGKTAFVKLAGSPDARAIKVEQFDEGGIWFRDEVLTLDLIGQTATKGRPMLIEEKHPLTFVAYHGFDWQ